MATVYYGDNYTSQYITKPSLKIQKGEVAGRKRLLYDKDTLAAALQVGDTIEIGHIPANSIVTDAKVFISKSLGATGIFDLGYKANGVDAADSDAFVKSADAGGQAALQRMTYQSAGAFKRFTAETQVVLICTEVMDGTVLDGILHIEVEYVND
jgi:hypothetical protein